MNPFDFRGPAFLGFYLIASAIGLLVLYLVSRRGPAHLPSGEARRQLRDPYLLAFLRGGARETLLTVAFSLHQRKLLSSAGEGMRATGSKDALQAVGNRLEHAVLSECRSTQTVRQLLGSASLRDAAEAYAEPLRETGLIADETEMARRLPFFLFVGGGLLAMSATKLYLAFQRGHSNVVFLIVLTGLALVLAYKIFQSRNTNAGHVALRDQQTLFERLKSRVNRLATDGATNEAVLVAAAFGLFALPQTAYPFAARMRETLQSTSSSSSSCGSSCSSCSSSCSSSSCGGGGGGCGGCGS